MSAALGLFRLQQVDSQIDHAQAQLEAIRKSLENDLELRDAQAGLEKAETYFKQAASGLKEIETEAAIQKNKIEQAESRLYGGEVQNPKELQDLQMDVISLKKQMVILEEREFELMLAVESAEKEVSASRGNLDQCIARRGDAHKQLLLDQARYMADLERLTAERNAAVSPIIADLLSTYEELRRQKRGLAVTDFAEDTCSACGAALNAALQQNSKSAARLAYCPVCGRILFSK
jgi:hypothetical protein